MTQTKAAARQDDNVRRLHLPHAPGEGGSLLVPVKGIEPIEFSEEQLEIISKTYFPQNATDAEKQFCLHVAKALGLNPITREIFFLSRRAQVNGNWVNRIEPMVGRDGFLSIAHKSSLFDGMDTTCELQEVPVYDENTGMWAAGGKDLVATCKVWRKDTKEPFVVRVLYREYVQVTNAGMINSMWWEKPVTMLSKVAESQALRKAFSIHGVYSPEEMGPYVTTEGGVICTDEIPPGARDVTTPSSRDQQPSDPKQRRGGPPSQGRSDSPPESPKDKQPEPPALPKDLLDEADQICKKLEQHGFEDWTPHMGTEKPPPADRYIRMEKISYGVQIMARSRARTGTLAALGFQEHIEKGFWMIDLRVAN